jgi:hypothetical protein
VEVGWAVTVFVMVTMTFVVIFELLEDFLVVLVVGFAVTVTTFVTVEVDGGSTVTSSVTVTTTWAYYNIISTAKERAVKIRCLQPSQQEPGNSQLW